MAEGDDALGLFSNRTPPNIPNAPREYSQSVFDYLFAALRLYYQQLDAVQTINVASLNIDLTTLPTQADLADLRTGDVYRDTSASNVLKVKT